MPRITQREYDCLRAVNGLTANGWTARVKDVADRMQVKPPTAIGFLERLSKASIIERGASGYRLAPKGARLLDELTRTHRLFETLFVRTGLSIAEAHRVSSSIDTHVGDGTAALLCARLNHPKRCPHDEPIPAGDRYD